MGAGWRTDPWRTTPSRVEGSISRLPGELANLPLQHPELITEGEHLGADLGVGAGADEHEIGMKRIR